MELDNKISRRDFLKSSGLLALGASLGTWSITGCSKKRLLKGTKKFRVICNNCNFGCALNLYKNNNEILFVEGEKKSKVNSGKICARGECVKFSTPKGYSKGAIHKAAGSDIWIEIDYAEGVRLLAAKIKETRDSTFIPSVDGVTVNRLESIASIGGASLTNEEAYLWGKLYRMLGLINFSTEGETTYNRALSENLGYPGSSNPANDLVNSDVILFIGADLTAEAPLLSQILLETSESEQKRLYVGHRYNETSTMSDMVCRLRPGSEVYLINSIINIALQNNRFNREYVINYTNASYILSTDYNFDNGIFSGYDSANKFYVTDSWAYQLDRKGIPAIDRSLHDPQTVFQKAKLFYSRYTPDVVSGYTGLTVSEINNLADIYLATASQDRCGAVVCSFRTSQQENAASLYQAIAFLQLIAGNIGISGGGILTLSALANLQGAADNGLSGEFLPGYLPVPTIYGTRRDNDFETYIRNIAPLSNDSMSINHRTKYNYYFRYLMRAFFGSNASELNNFAFDWLPKSTSPVNLISIMNGIGNGSFTGAISLNNDSFFSESNFSLSANSISRLKWFASFGNETECSAGYLKKYPKSTEVLFFPVITGLNSGSRTGCDRRIQWSDGAGTFAAKSMLDVVNDLYLELKKLYTAGGSFPDPIVKSNWNYASLTGGNISAEAVAKEISGYLFSTRDSIKTDSIDGDDTGIVCGNWLYAGYFEETELPVKRQHPVNGFYWPKDISILYNRASVNSNGKPYNHNKVIVSCENGTWKGEKPDGDIRFTPQQRNPFVMNYEGVGRLFCHASKFGPFSVSYELPESGFGSMDKGSLALFEKKAPYFANGNQFNLIATVSRSSVHLTAIEYAGYGIVRELYAGPCCEINPELAARYGLIKNDNVKISTIRGSIILPVVITGKIGAYNTNGRHIDSINLIASGISSGSESLRNFNQIGFISANGGVVLAKMEKVK